VNADAGLPGVLNRVGELAKQIGADRDSDLDAIRHFVEGPEVITVAAESGDYASGVVALVESSAIRADVQQISLGDATQPALRDLLVVVTSADRALSRSEEEVVRAAHAHGGVVAVAVVEAAVFGDGPALWQAVKEIERLRLHPTLTPLAVPWFFLGTAGNDEAFTAVVRRAQPAGHERAARRVLDSVVHSMLDAVAPRLAAQESEVARWRKAETELAYVPSRLEHEAGLIQLSVRKSLNSAEQNVYQAGLETPDLVASWQAAGRHADWAAVELPLRQSWRRCVDVAQHVVDQLRTRFAGEIARLDPTTQIGLPPSGSTALSLSWDTAELEAALAALATVDLDGIFADLREQSEPEPQEEQEDPLLDLIGVPGQVTEAGLPDGLRAQLNAGLHFAIAGRMHAVVAAADAAVTGGARADAAAGMAVFAERLAARRATLEDLGCWRTAYAELAGLARELEARIDRGLLSGGTSGA
jgi:hypothetical protein